MPFGSLWLPVVVSAVAVWFVSAILHMALKYHRADYRRLPDEEAIRAALKKAAPAPGLYVTPYCTEGSQMKDPAMIKQYEEGPVGLLAVMPNGAPNLGKSLGLWLVFCFLVSFITAYVARHTLNAGTDGLTVLRITGTIAFMGYGLGYFADVIWKAVPWSNALRGLLDAVVYALVTGYAFCLLWPA